MEANVVPETLFIIVYGAMFLLTYVVLLHRAWAVKIKQSAKSGKTKKAIKQPTGDDYAGAFLAGMFWPAYWGVIFLRDVAYWVKPKEIKKIENELEIEKLERDNLSD